MGDLRRALAGSTGLLLALLLAAPATAQRTTASLTGRVVDASASAVPGASVTITSADTRVAAWQGVTDATGSYLAPSLPVGRYDITVELQGFKTVTVRGVPLAVAQRARVDARLDPGAISETVTVVGGALGQLETEDSSMGLVIDPDQVRGLPLPNRNVLNLVALAGGVSTTTGDTGQVNSAQMSFKDFVRIRNEKTRDGVSVVTGSTGNANRLPSTEAIREFKVQTASYSAEFGRTAGGYVNRSEERR